MAGRYGSVVVRDRDCDENGPGSNPGLGFPFLLIETLSKRSVLEMAATLYERDNCHGDLLLQQIIVSCLLQKLCTSLSVIKLAVLSSRLNVGPGLGCSKIIISADNC